MHDRYAPVVYEPLFPTATPPVPGSRDEDLTRFYVVELPEGGDIAHARADYATVPGIAGAERVPLTQATYLPNDPRLGDQWQLGQPSDHDSDVLEAWDLARGDTSIVIAILDTGVLYSHDDLGGSTPPHTAGTIAHNWIEMGGVAGVDDDGNGFVDDLRGWDFVTGGSGVPGEDVSFADNDPIDFAGHGTFCAGMASARTDNGVGIAGTAFGARILPLRIGWKDAPSSPGQIDMGYASQAIVYAADNGAHIVNCSWENIRIPALTSAVNYAVGRGVTLCVAAGNANTQSTGQNYLASRGDCVDVAGVDQNDVKTGFSNYGTWVDVSAAATSVTSTWGGMSVPGYLTSGGTSVSAPFVAGAIALYQAYRRSLGLPLATPLENRLRVHDTGDDLDSLNPAYVGRLGTRLNVLRLLMDPILGVPDDPNHIGRTLTLAALPNPSAARVKLVVGRPGAGSCGDAHGEDGVRIFSVAGRRVRTLPIDPTARTATLTWDGDDDRGQPVGPGLYFAHARWGGCEARFRLVRLR